MRHDAHFVEQLFRADELPIGRKIPLHLIEANPNQPRSVMGDLNDLKNSIIEKGVLEPILVRPREDGRFTIIAGERRFRASMEAGLAEIPCIELDVDDKGLLEITLVENLQRKDLTPFEEADGYLALRDRYGYTHEQIARSVGKSRVTITETLSFAALPVAVKDECRRADIQSRSFLSELGRLEDEHRMLEAVRAYAEGGGGRSREALRELRRGTLRDAATQQLKKNFEFTYAPDDRTYSVSLVLRGSHEREEVLATLRGLLKRIDAGEIDLEKNGRFVRASKR